MLQFEQTAWQRFRRVAGVDEAGRGPLAGPVVAAAVVIEPDFLMREAQGLVQSLTDSKQLTEKNRELFFCVLTSAPQVRFGVGIVSEREIDRRNILRATHEAMAQALRAVDPLPEYALVDGRPVPGLPCDSEAIVKGDARSLSIAAASVIAKVTRDRLMLEMDRTWPQYGFARHKGYGTKEHLEALMRYGPAPCHRRSFRPVRVAAGEMPPPPDQLELPL
ncbi:MAG: ribonuclease HII [Kiritimatiellae bacterium]|nr:ribonuclease HII [Kiritimatiellia bacterium]